MSLSDKIEGLIEASDIARNFAPHAKGREAQATANSIADIIDQRIAELKEKE